MNKIEIDITNGYGIEKLKHTFDFNGSTSFPQQDTNIIYAQNGTMKSSFAKVLNDYSEDVQIKDHIFDIKGSCSVKDDTGNDVPKNRVFSVASFDNGQFESKKSANLLVNSNLRAEYEVHMNKFNASLVTLLERIKSVARLNSKTSYEEIINLICREYGETVPRTPQSLLSIVVSHRKEIESKPDYIQDIPFSVIGSKDAQKFAVENKGIIQELMAVYEEIKMTAAFVV